MLIGFKFAAPADLKFRVKPHDRLPSYAQHVVGIPYDNRFRRLAQNDLVFGFCGDIQEAVGGQMDTEVFFCSFPVLKIPTGTVRVIGSADTDEALLLGRMEQYPLAPA